MEDLVLKIQIMKHSIMILTYFQVIYFNFFINYKYLKFFFNQLKLLKSLMIPKININAKYVKKHLNFNV